MFKFLGKNWAWILSIIFATVITILIIFNLEEIKVWIQDHWFIFPMLMIPAYSAGIFINSFTIRAIITAARGAGKESYGVNFGELAAIDITDKTRDSLWLHGGLVVLSISGIILLIILL
jgi:hypothetical protein